MKRYLYMGCAVLLALVTAVLVLRSQHTVPVVFATHDMAAGTQVTADDLEVRRVHDDGVPAGALSDLESATGRYAALPLTAGEPVLDRAVAAQRSGSGLSRQFNLPTGFVAVAVPVQPAGAVGGMLQAGDRVDVYATPLVARASAGTTSSESGSTVPARLLGRDVLVLELRSDQGQSLQQKADPGGSVHGLNFGSGKLGSVVIAVPSTEVERYAAAASGEAFYLALSVG